MYHKRTPLVTKEINVTIESLVFQNKHLNGAYFISDIKLPWNDQKDCVTFRENNEIKTKKIWSAWTVICVNL